MTNKENAGAERSELWQRAFRDEGTNASVSRIVTSLRDIRKKVQQLSSRIADSIPGLTIHDISHLDALWEVANTVAGPDYPLNPLEAYVFGASVLLHDAGLCFEAYSGGKDAVRDTLEWRDAYGRLSRIVGGSHNLKHEADLEALRSLHASQAARLATEPFGLENRGIYLIDDQYLRENYGELVGNIASSHHWDLEAVESRFKIPRPAAAFLDADWVVDSLKVACLLRVADAGHLDGTRAPSFLLRVLQMNSLSRTHWEAQNKLGRLAAKPDDPAQLMVASTRPFLRDESAAWWVAFDLIGAFDRELRQSNAVLDASSAGPRRAFAKKSVAGAGQVRELVQYVETDGWEPTDSTVHVSDVANLVTTLGGEQLYGKDADRLNIALRELIQNATDAICGRRSLSNSIGFVGQIVIRLLKRDGGWTLQVDDDGVGMSSTTLSTDLLDFGRSFWVSERAAREFPGIHASGYIPIGRFGIGFFSIFMAARSVRVFSRRFDTGLDHVRCLSFDNGISLRPTLSSERPDDMGMYVCTRVEVEMKQGVVDDPDHIAIRCPIQGYDDLMVSFEDYVAAMVAGLDVPVVVERAGGQRKVQDRFPPDASKREAWLRTLSYLNAGVNQSASTGLARALSRLREIRDGQRCYGLAAIDVLSRYGGVFLSSKAVGGLVNPHARYDDSFIGLIEHLPATAQRGPGEMAAPQESIERWVSEQIGLLKKANLSKEESLLASYSICDFGLDPIDVLQALLLSSDSGLTFLSMDTLANSLRCGLRLAFPISQAIGRHLDSHSGRLNIPGLSCCVVVRNGKFNCATLAAGVPSAPNSLVGVVHRVLVNAGESPTWSRRPSENPSRYAHWGSFAGPAAILASSFGSRLLPVTRLRERHRRLVSACQLDVEVCRSPASRWWLRSRDDVVRWVGDAAYRQHRLALQR